MDKQILRKLIKEEILNIVYEVGEGTGKIYDWKIDRIKNLSQDRKIYRYLFDSENIDYVVTIYVEPPRSSVSNEDKLAAITFYADDSADFANYEKSTNLNELYNVMATVMDITLNFIKTNEDINQIYISPSKAFKDDNRRTKLYTAYIQKNLSKLPGQWKADYSDPEVINIYKQS